jgi:hypothetical protein
MIRLETYLGFPFGRDFRGRHSLVPSRSLSRALVPSIARSLSLARSFALYLGRSLVPFCRSVALTFGRPVSFGPWGASSGPIFLVNG